jgi:hypothetical protein
MRLYVCTYLLYEHCYTLLIGQQRTYVLTHSVLCVLSRRTDILSYGPHVSFRTHPYDTHTLLNLQTTPIGCSACVRACVADNFTVHS